MGMRRIHPLVRVAAGLWFALASQAWAQTSSMFGDPARRRPLTLSQYSWTYQAPAEVPVIRPNDLITIVVDEKSVVVSEGEMDRKKKARGDLTLKDWILMKGLAFVPDPQSAGDPKISGELDNKMRSEAGFESRDSMKFRIACRVIDIRPNGNLIIEGRRHIQNNNDTWEYSLTGEIRPEAVQPNNTVLSENVADMRIYKREAGHVRDGYRRGWLLQWLDRYQPF
jgi:flagellar L-ring protein precursor FlgH